MQGEYGESFVDKSYCSNGFTFKNKTILDISRFKNNLPKISRILLQSAAFQSQNFDRDHLIASHNQQV